ncbi:unnamed protein product [[Candida] boidinii]|nr:unnamed protein product [[Candida] boidinii]
MYDTYWKSTNNKNNNDNNNNDDNNSIITTATNNRTTTYVSFVTASSVSGEYFTVHICLLSDGTPIVCPSWQVHIGNNVYLPVTSFTMETLKSILIKQNDINYDYLLNELKNIKDLSKDSKKLEKILSILYIPLNEFLKLLPIQISLNLEIFFPSLYEFEFCNLNYSINSFNLTNKCKNEKEMNTLTDSILNNFIDLILFDVFNHVRELRSSNSIANRHLILSSDNSSVCTILNWKQPNYPVFYNINGIKYDSKFNKFNKRTANGFNIENKEYHQLLLKNYPNNKYNSMISNNNNSKYSSNNNNTNSNSNNNNNNNSSNGSNSKIDDNGDDHEDEDNYDISNEFSVNIENIDSINKHSSAYTNELMNQDRLTRSVKLAINFAAINNLLGIIIPNKLLHICPELVRSIRSKGLILVASGGGNNNNIQPMDLNKSSLNNQSKELSGFENGDDVMNDGQEDVDDEEDVDSDDKSHMDVDWGMGVNDVNGLRFNDILTFKDAIDM